MHLEALSKQWNNVEIIIYCLCYNAVNRSLCSEMKELPDLVMSPLLVAFLL